MRLLYFAHKKSAVEKIFSTALKKILIGGNLRQGDFHVILRFAIDLHTYSLTKNRRVVKFSVFIGAVN